MNKRLPLHFAGFAFGEMITAIGVMGLLSALVMPLLAFDNGLNQVQEKRNARLLASVCFQAQQAGVNFVAPADVDTTVQNLLAGGQASSGRKFQVVGINQPEATAATKHLRILEGNLLYVP